MWPAETIRLVAKLPQRGIFLTGIESSDPAVDGVRRNQLREAHDFQLHYAERLERIRQLGITWLRYGPPYSQAHPSADQYDFELTDKVVAKCRQLGITLIADLLHFGLPDWLHAKNEDGLYFQNSYFPYEFAKYAAHFAERYPEIQYYTLVNEPFVAAYLSAKLGLWNEQLTSDWRDDRQFVRAVANIAKAVIIGRRAIEQVWQQEKRPDEPLFVQNESFELAIAAPGSGREAEARQFNLRRFAALDLIFGRRDAAMAEYLTSNGMKEAEYEWFIDHGRRDRTILGIDHYPTCVHTFEANRTADHDPLKPYRLFELIDEYWRRYPLPLLHTEVNGWPEHALGLCQQTYDILSRLRREGYPVLGMGWYGDELQIGWQVAMRGPESYAENPVGLFHYGQPNSVAELFGELAAKGMPLFDHREAKYRMK